MFEAETEGLGRAVTVVSAEAAKGLEFDAVVVVERSVSSPPVSWPSGWTVWPARRYGDTRVEAAEVP